MKNKGGPIDRKLDIPLDVSQTAPCEAALPYFPETRCSSFAQNLGFHAAKGAPHPVYSTLPDQRPK
ncbi:hypothetical protein J6590_066758 [Homalodisca vitripennis]|nr:hypothetical protein J6590_066758 [Homalodisca vitripennis]